MAAVQRLRAGRSASTMAVEVLAARLGGIDAPRDPLSPGFRREPVVLSDNEIRDLLQRARTIAVVGLSDQPDRPSYSVARFLQRAGYRVIPVNPHLRRPVLGEQPYASLRDVKEHVDLVDIFRIPEMVPEVVEDAIAIGADAVWMQLGIVNEEAARRAEQAGLGVVMDRCTAIEHRRLLRGL